MTAQWMWNNSPLINFGLQEQLKPISDLLGVIGNLVPHHSAPFNLGQSMTNHMLQGTEFSTLLPKVIDSHKIITGMPINLLPNSNLMHFIEIIYNVVKQLMSSPQIIAFIDSLLPLHHSNTVRFSELSGHLADMKAEVQAGDTSSSDIIHIVINTLQRIMGDLNNHSSQKHPLTGPLNGVSTPFGTSTDNKYTNPNLAKPNDAYAFTSGVSDAGSFVLSETSLYLHCWGENPVVTAKLQLNGQDRFSEREGTYFDLVQPYQAHTRNPDTGINVYSFALRPEEHQPSGTCNFSRIDNATLQLVLSNATVEGTKTAKVRVYATNYNVLRIMSGMGGLAYSN